MVLIRASLLAAMLAVLAGCSCLPGAQNQGLAAADPDETPVVRRDDVGKGSEL
jgi:hypothetical protein